MMKNTTLRSIGAGLLLLGLAVFTTQTIRADMHSFSIRVYHGINGTSLGLSKDLPVEATVELDGEVLAVLPLDFGDEIETELPAGTYRITVYSVELDAQLDSMTIGPVDIPPGVDVNLHAKLSSNKTPIIKAKVK
jgi:hypothetical protein